MDHCWQHRLWNETEWLVVARVVAHLAQPPTMPTVTTMAAPLRRGLVAQEVQVEIPLLSWLHIHLPALPTPTSLIILHLMNIDNFY